MLSGRGRLILVSITVFIVLSGAPFVTAQQPPPPAGQTDDVIRVNSDLVQSDVTVIDKQGHFVDGLRKDQFELRVNGRPQDISFFERVTAGSGAEARQLTRMQEKPSVTVPPASSEPDRGRIIFFFVDDVHLNGENVARTRQAILDFIDDRMRIDDRVAIVAASGRIGFLQQVTSNKAVLRAAANRIRDQRRTDPYAGKVQISEFEANQVANAHNRELFRYLVEATAAEFQMDAQTAANMVLNRVAQIESQARVSTADTLTALEGLIRSSAPLPGRKFVFFVSAGFIVDPRASSAFDRMRRLTKTAAQVGAVLYALDARGGFVDTHVDASQNPYPDFTGTVSRDVFAEGQATQEPLRVLSHETGGRVFLNSNSFEDSFDKGLAEGSNYYLLAWQPQRDEDRAPRTRLTIGIVGRSDLKVRLRRGFVEAPALTNGTLDRKARNSPPATPEAALLGALGSLYPVTGLPVSLSVGYLNTARDGSTLSAAMRIELADLGGEPGSHQIDVMGVALDDRGSIASFRQKLTVDPETVERAGQNAVIWNQQLPLRPGLYQVRVAVLDRQHERVGSTMQWIEIPNTGAESLSVSSIFIGERKTSGTNAADRVAVNVSGRLDRNSFLRYQLYVYHATGGAAADVSVKVNIFREGESVMAVAPAKLSTIGATDPARLLHSGELALDQLAPGRYVLQIVASDQKASKTATQRTEFIVN